MGWSCYSCGTKNPNSADQCQKCGGTVAAPRSFYIGWIFGGGMFFLVTYIAGTLAGGVLVEFVASPENEDILAYANANKQEGETDAKSVEHLANEPERLAAAKAAVIERNKSKLSSFTKGLVYWCLPVVLFVICGIIVGFVSDGRTVIEAGLGSVVGQGVGWVLHVYAFETGLPWLALAVGIVPGFGLGVLGAWLGEVLQERKERAGGITG
jgi:hypothetical protein